MHDNFVIFKRNSLRIMFGHRRELHSENNFSVKFLKVKVFLIANPVNFFLNFYILYITLNIFIFYDIFFLNKEEKIKCMKIAINVIDFK